MTVREIQQALQAAGFNPGPVDGIRGRKTIAAIKEYHTAGTGEREVDLIKRGVRGPVRPYSRTYPARRETYL
jgi:hypothetical protein